MSNRLPSRRYAIGPRLSKAIDALAAGKTREQAAVKAKMSLSGLKAALRKSNVRNELFERLREGVLEASLGAPQALSSALVGPHMTSRVQAAKTLLDAVGIGGDKFAISVNVGGGPGIPGGCLTDANWEGRLPVPGEPAYVIDLRSPEAVERCPDPTQAIAEFERRALPAPEKAAEPLDMFAE